MDFEFFNALAPREAQEFLCHYLDAEAQATRALIAAAEADGVGTDFSVASVPGVLKWMLPRLRIVFSEWDESVPKWLRDCEEHKRGQVSFEEESKNLVLRASYYLGESFVRQYKTLAWGLGSPNTAFHNMPVVTGFMYNKELPTILVAENSLLRIVEMGASAEEIDATIAHWQGYVR